MFAGIKLQNPGGLTKLKKVNSQNLIAKQMFYLCLYYICTVFF